MHQHNADERAIRTFNNHLISGLCIVNSNYPLQLCVRLLDQATTTLNLMHNSKINPKLSAREQLFGIFKFNITPFSPQRTRFLVHDKTENEATYGHHGSDGGYIGRAPLHYIFFKCYTISTKYERTSDTVDFFHRHFEMPKTSSADTYPIYESQSIHALENQTPA